MPRLKRRGYGWEPERTKSPVELLLDERKQWMDDVVREIALKAPDGLLVKDKITVIGSNDVIEDGLTKELLTELKRHVILQWLCESKTLFHTYMDDGFYIYHLSEDGFNWAAEIDECRMRTRIEEQYQQECSVS